MNIWGDQFPTATHMTEPLSRLTLIVSVAQHDRISPEKAVAYFFCSSNWQFHPSKSIKPKKKCFVWVYFTTWDWGDVQIWIPAVRKSRESASKAMNLTDHTFVLFVTKAWKQTLFFWFVFFFFTTSEQILSKVSEGEIWNLCFMISSSRNRIEFELPTVTGRSSATAECGTNHTLHPIISIC